MSARFGAIAAIGAAALVVVTAAPSARQRAELLPTNTGQVTAIAFDPSNSNVVYLAAEPGPGGDHDRVYKSTDGGRDWRKISGHHWDRTYAIAVDPQHPRTVYVGGGHAVWKTTDGGRTWHAFSRGLLHPGINRGEGWVDWLTVDPRKSNVLYEHDYAGTLRESVDGGRSWHVTVSPHARFVAVPGAMRVAWTRPPTIYAPSGSWNSDSTSFTYGLNASSNGGQTWRATGLHVSVQTHQNIPLLSIAVDPWRPASVYAVLGAPDSIIFMSTDSGKSWQSIGSGFPAHAGVTSFAVGRRTLYASLGSGGIWETSDKGATWTQTWPSSGPAPGLGVGLLAVDPGDPTTVLAAATYPSYGPTGTHLLRSTDGGLNWEVVG